MSYFIQNSCIPIQKVLDFFGLTLSQYLNLEVVPFPVVLEIGRVVYPGLISYDMNLLEPTDTGRTNYSESQILREGYVDYGIYDNNHTTNISFRLKRSPIDANLSDFTYSSELVKTETKDSSENLYMSKVTGRQRKEYRLQNDSYHFSSFDFINDTHADRAKILDGKHRGIYDEATRSIIIEPLSTRQLKKLKPGNTNMAIQTESIVEQNKAALITATKLEVGALALDLVSTQVVKTLPVPIQLMVGESPLVKVAIANVVNLIMSQTNIDDERLVAVNEAMMTVAWIETIKTLDIKGMVEAALSSIPTAKLDALVAAKKVD